ncbi:MAG: transporter substrate-binding domain-containing protein [Rhodobacteraceae bacterium]|nr:transporter substrate-binding domain-containing protein [Paracoccaceae bacterium]MCY4197440.1 transporter substrate-binding domain-containing protein [Paracoccaceae bacterium]
MKQSLLTAIAVMLSSLMATTMQAQVTDSKLYEVLDRGYLVFGTGSTNVPWHFVNDQNELAGFDVDMGRIIARGIFGDDTKIEYVRQAPDARIPNLLTDKTDVTCQFMTINTSRAQKVEFTIPYYREGTALILSAGGRYPDREAIDAAIAEGDEVRVAVLQNAGAEDTVFDVIEDVKVDQYEEQGLVFEAIDTGRADGGVVDLSNVLWLVKQSPDRYAYGGDGTRASSYGCAVKPGDPIWLNFLDTVLRESMNGRDFAAYADSFESWFGIRPPAPKIGFPIELR